VSDGGGVGEAGGLDHGAAELGHLAAAALWKKFAQRIHQVAAHRAAQAARVEKHDVLADLAHQQVIEADLAELVDEHGGLPHGGVGEKMVEECRLAAAQEPGDDGNRDGLDRSRLDCPFHQP
jgi:hypothetical protein